MPAPASQPASCSVMCLCLPPLRTIQIHLLLRSPVPAASTFLNFSFLITRLSKPFFSSASGPSPTCELCRDSTPPSRCLLCVLSSQNKPPTPQAVYLQSFELSISSSKRSLSLTSLSSTNPSFCLFFSSSVNLSILPSHPVHFQAFTKCIGHHCSSFPFSHFELSSNYFTGLSDSWPDHIAPCSSLFS